MGDLDIILHTDMYFLFFMEHLQRESKFLSHWFGLVDAGNEALSGPLPRPSPWNKFVTETEEYEAPEVTPEAGLRSFAKASGLPAESKFLSHWFGIAKASEHVASE